MERQVRKHTTYTLICSKCKEDKSTDEFNMVGAYFGSYCRPCRNEYHREWRRKLKDEEARH